MSARGAKWTRREVLGASASWALALSLKPSGMASAESTAQNARPGGRGRPNIVLFVPDELYDCERDPRQENNLFGDSSARALQEEHERRLTNWYIDTTGVPPPERDPRGAPVLDRPPELKRVAPLGSLLDH